MISAVQTSFSGFTIDTESMCEVHPESIAAAFFPGALRATAIPPNSQVVIVATLVSVVFVVARQLQFRWKHCAAL